MKNRKHLSFTAMRQTFSSLLLSCAEHRAKNTQIRLHDVVMSGLACMFYQDNSLLQFQRRLEEKQSTSNLYTQFAIHRVPKTTQMRAMLDEFPSQHLRPLFKHVITQLQRAQCLKPFQSPLGGYLCSLDGTQYYASTKVHCPHCLTFNKKTGRLYTHRMVQAALVHPDQRVVFPVMPEEISNHHRAKTGLQDSERRASERLVDQLKKTHPRLKLTLLGDALYAEAPFIQKAKATGYSFILTVKPDRHRYLFEEIGMVTTPKQEHVVYKGQYRHTYTWVEHMPLNAKKSIKIHYFAYDLARQQSPNTYKTVYKNTWVTDHAINRETIIELVRSGRCRWKIENECFNNLKNQGYCLEHNFGHGEKHLSFNFASLMVLAFLCHQVLAFTDALFQATRKKHGSKRYLWESLRSFIRWIIFDSFEALMRFSLAPGEYHLLPRSPPVAA